MKVLLDGLLPQLFPGLEFLCVPHDGKNDLERSIPKKLRAWREPGVRFMVVRDNDGGDCHQLKAHLLALCHDGRRDDTLVRIPCQELEAWYFGEPEALAEAYFDERLLSISLKRRYRNPDTIVSPSSELAKLIPEFQKVSGARKLASLLSRERNRSTSFRVLLKGIEACLEVESSGTEGYVAN